MRSLLPALAVAPLLLSACSYEYSNPAERLAMGEATGRLVADLSGTGQLSPVAGATVTLKGSANVQTTRENGRFFVTGLVAGRHTLLFEKGSWALQRDVEIGYDSQGQLEGVELGDLRLRYAVTLGGSFTPPSGYAIDPYPFTAPVAVAFDEATGVQATVTPEGDGWSAPFTGRFFYTIPVAPVGPHRIRFAITAEYGGLRTTWVGGPIAQDVPVSSEGQSLTLAPAVLRVPDTSTPGKLRFRVGASMGVPAFTIRVNTVPATTEQTPTPDSTGWVELDLVEGVYTVLLDLGATAGTFVAPAAVTAVVVAGQTTELGTLYLLDSTIVDQATSTCLTSADCFEMYSCVNRQCVFNEPHYQPLACLTGSIASTCTSAVPPGCVSTPPSSPVLCTDGVSACAWVTGASTWACVPSGSYECLYAGTELVVAPMCN